MPHVSQQAKMRGDPTQSNHNHPRQHQKQRGRCDIDAEQIDLAESHLDAPASKYSACWVSPSDTTRMHPRALIAPDAPGASLGRDARALSRVARYLVAKPLFPSAIASRASTTKEASPSRRAMPRRL